MTMIKPGSKIGIIGSGQLGKMLAIAAARLGYKTCVLGDPDAHVHLYGKEDRPGRKVGHITSFIN